MKSLTQKIKKRMYFVVARYFGRYASKVLDEWRPRIIVVTGSSGKTTMLNMLESQIGDIAEFTHNANSAIGIPFHILGMRGIQKSRKEWIGKFLQAPFAVRKVQHSKKIYVVEADADRPGEGEFLAQLLRPSITVWVSSSRTHSMNYEGLVKSGDFSILEDAIAYEYAHFAKNTKDLVLTDGDNEFIKRSLKDCKADINYINREEAISDYRVSLKESMVSLIEGASYTFSQPQPPVIAYQVAFLDELLRILGVKPDYSFSKLDYPPGRSRVFKSKIGFTILDSSYNANFDSMRTMLRMFEKYPGKNKFLVLGDMLEQGDNEVEEHRRLAELILSLSFKPKQVILLGPRVKKHTYPLLIEKMPKTPVSVFINPHDVLDYLKAECQGDEVVLFKGARFLEGVIEHLLKNKKDSQYLCRRGPLWDKRRAEWGL